MYIYIYNTYIVGKSICTSFRNRQKQRALGRLFCPVSKRVQMNYIFSDNVHILCLSCNAKKRPKQLPNCLKRASYGVLCEVGAYTVTVSDR